MNDLICIDCIYSEILLPKRAVTIVHSDAVCMDHAKARADTARRAKALRKGRKGQAIR